MTTRFKVADATCGHCKQTVETAVSALDGVESAELDLATKDLLVAHEEEVSTADLVRSIEAAGYTPELIS